MEDKNASLQRAVDAYREHLEKTALPKLKDQFRILYSAFNGIRDILLKRAIIHEDPYKNDRKISEISPPSDAPFLESEKTEELSIRLSRYEAQFDFLLNYYQFSTEFLDMKRIKLLVALLRYISWDQFSETHKDITTRALAECVARIKRGSDNISIGIINSSLDQIRKSTQICLAGLKNLANFQKEAYKLEIRLQVLPQVSIKAEQALSQKNAILKKIRQVFGTELPGKPFYPELVGEILEENYGPHGEEMIAAIIARLRVKEEKKTPLSHQVSFPAILREAIRSLASVSRYLEEAAQKLWNNHELMQNRKVSLVEKFKKWIHSMQSGKSTPIIYEVEYFDITTSSSKRESITFEPFIDTVRRNVRIYNGILTRTGNLYRRMEEADEKQLSAFLDKHLGDLSITFRRMEALDSFFKDNVEGKQRQFLRGIKIELTAIKNNMVKANQKKHEYTSRKEEAEQMKKLGFKLS